MALIVEDGTGMATATSYVSLADADAYFALRATAAWDEAEDADKEVALVKATAALDARFRGMWKGKKLTKAQALAWPREEVVDEEGFDIAENEIPLQLKQATYEVGLLELSGTPFIQETTSKEDMVKSETVGPISTTYMDNAPAIPVYNKVNHLLQGLANTGPAALGIAIGLIDEELGIETDPVKRLVEFNE